MQLPSMRSSLFVAFQLGYQILSSLLFVCVILKYANGKILDPFANECSIKNHLKNCEYISNDLDTTFDTDYHLEAQDFMKLFEDNSVDVILFDPPYSGRQVAECYKKLNKTVSRI